MAMQDVPGLNAENVVGESGTQIGFGTAGNEHDNEQRCCGAML